jgi:radical SAM protein with 4Fe4S-binding SPASM domain
MCPIILSMDYKTYRKAWDNAHKTTPNIPLNLDIELSTACNLRCPFCFIQSDKYKSSTTPFMNKHLAMLAIDNAHELGIPALKFNWRGEPTIHPDFSEILAHTARYDFKEVLINTNGNYPSSALYAFLHCTKVMFSLDSFSATTYKQMRPGGNLNKVLDNIEALTQFGHRNIWVRRVLTDSNKAEDFKSSCAQKFGDKVKVAEHHCFDRVKAQKANYKRTYCAYPSQRLVMATDGTVYPCCIDYHGKLEIGKFPKDSLAEMWGGLKMKLLRASLKKGEVIPRVCKSCTSWMAYKAPQRKKVMDKEL